MATRPPDDGGAVSPAIGPLPSIYVPPSPDQAGPAAILWHDLAATPELVNTDPYGQGWMFEAEIDPATLNQQLAGLMDAGAYRRLAAA
jgi:hypothetical protein